MPATKTKPKAGYKVVKMKASRRLRLNTDKGPARIHLPKGEILELPATSADKFIQQKIAVEVPGAKPTVNSEPTPITPITPKD